MRKNITQTSLQIFGNTEQFGSEVFRAVCLPNPVSSLRLILRAWYMHAIDVCGLSATGNAGTSDKWLNRHVTAHYEMSSVAVGNSPSLGDRRVSRIGLILS